MSKPFDVNVSFFDGIWTAECDELGLVTEADSYEHLTVKSLCCAPELAELNAVGLDDDTIHLRFFHEQSIKKAAA